MPITIGALKESAPGETRVSLVPEVVDKFTATGARVVLESGAGIRAQFPDALYKKGEWVASSAALLSQADVLLTVGTTVDQIGQLKPGTVVVVSASPRPPRRGGALRDRKVTSFAVELIPRISWPSRWMACLPRHRWPATRPCSSPLTISRSSCPC